MKNPTINNRIAIYASGNMRPGTEYPLLCMSKKIFLLIQGGRCKISFWWRQLKGCYSERSSDLREQIWGSPLLQGRGLLFYASAEHPDMLMRIPATLKMFYLCWFLKMWAWWLVLFLGFLLFLMFILLLYIHATLNLIFLRQTRSTTYMLSRWVVRTPKAFWTPSGSISL